jgi:hypothetical protein
MPADLFICPKMPPYKWGRFLKEMDGISGAEMGACWLAA